VVAVAVVEVEVLAHFEGGWLEGVVVLEVGMMWEGGVLEEVMVVVMVRWREAGLLVDEDFVRGRDAWDMGEVDGDGYLVGELCDEGRSVWMRRSRESICNA